MKKKLFKIAVIVCMTVSVMLGGQVTAFAEEVKPTDSVKTEWTNVAPMSTSRNRFQTEVLGGKIYAFGGPGLSSAEVYDPSTDKWTTLSSMSVARQFLQSVVINGKIYAIGGSGNDANTLSSMEVYDPAINKWISLSPMSTARMNFQVEVIDGNIYAIGGQSSNRLVSSTEIYNPISDKWTTLSSMSVARGDFQTEVINGKIYAFGGISESTAEVYDPSTDKWTKIASMSTARRYFHTEVINGKIYAIGGSRLSSAEVYDPSTDKWTTLSSMSVAREELQTEVINGKIYAIGGNGQSTAEVYDIVNNKWTNIASMSNTSRNFFRTEVINGSIYAIGGGGQSYVEVYTTPDTSSNLKATGGDSKVDLSWDTVTRATSYTVKRSTTAGGPYTAIATDITETSYADTDVTNGTIYYYIVNATNNGTEISYSNEASAKPIPDQTPPTTEAKLKVVLEIAESLRLSVDNDLNVNTQMSWSSSDPTVATVNEKGIVTALAPGNTVITVKSADGSYTDYINVLVVENADDYRLAIDLKIGETARLTADDFTNTTNITWAPMDSSIANVTSKGKVTALSKGLVLISAKDAEGNIIGRVYVRVRE